MRVAVVGAGVAGLSVCYYLLKKGFCVTLFDRGEPGSGASGVAAGLLHPYVGQKGIRSQFATEALEEAKKLLKAVEEHSSEKIVISEGIYRVQWDNPPQEEDVVTYPTLDVGFGVTASPAYLIASGVTVLMNRYLQGLFRYLSLQGLTFEQHDLNDLKPMEGFDQTVFAIGAGIRQFPLNLPVDFVKGQILSCRFSEKGERSVVGKGHISLTEQPGIIQLGGSYEHQYRDALPDMQSALEYIKPRITSWFPHWDMLEILSCNAGIRVCRKNGYLPIMEKLGERSWLLTAMGSRGLLYAPLYGRNLSNLMIENC